MGPPGALQVARRVIFTKKLLKSLEFGIIPLKLRNLRKPRLYMYIHVAYAYAIYSLGLGYICT